MSTSQKARPAFASPLRTPDYYVQTRAYIESLRATTTMRDIASMVNRMGWTSPAGKPWVRQTVMNFMRSRSI
jgi:hypothetical protein